MIAPLPGWKLNVFWAFVFAWVAGLSTFIYANHKGPTTLNIYERGSLNRMVEGTADRPFVYRALIPTIIRTLEVPFESRFTEDQDFKPYGDNDDKPGNRFLRSKTAFRVSAQIVLTWLCFIGMGFFVASTCRRLGRSTLASHLAGLMAIGAVPLWARFYSWSYDPATLFLCSFLLWSLVSESTGWFVIAFAIGCLNKETTAFWLPVFVMTMGLRRAPEDHKLKVHIPTWIVGAALALVWLAVTFTLHRLYGQNPGSDLENHMLGTNLDIIRKHQFGKLASLLVYVLYWHFARYEWRSAHPAVRLSLLWVGIPLLIGSMTIGNLDEIRALYDIVPTLTVLCAPAVIRVMSGMPAKPAEDDELPENEAP